jgi:hypothetical protein
MFCRNSIESSDHIYSLCSFTQGIWERVMHIYLVNNPLYCWDGVIDGGIRELQTRNFRASICNLALAATVYYVWLQRNARIYKGHIKPEEGIILSIKWDIKARVQFCSKVKLSVQNKVLCANWGISQSGLKK